MSENKIFRNLCFLAVLSIGGFIVPHKATAQSQMVAPVPFYRFVVNFTNLGNLLTANYQEGVNLNYAYTPFPVTAGIVLPPGAGWTPAPGQGLIPLYRWKVSQNGRIYYYYSWVYSSLGSGYTYQGVAGYVLPPDGSRGGIRLNAYYSQVRGYYFTVGTEQPPVGTGCYPGGPQIDCTGFGSQGTTCYLPQGGQYSFNPPPPPNPDNDGDGYPSNQDCNDYDSSVYPGASISCGSGQDKNCNGQDDYRECYP